MSDISAEVHTDLTPKEIVRRLDQYIIGQERRSERSPLHCVTATAV